MQTFFRGIVAALALALALVPLAADATIVLVQSDRAFLDTSYNADPAVCGGFGFLAGARYDGPLFGGPPRGIASTFCGEVLGANAAFGATGPELATTRLATAGRGEALGRYFLTFDVTGAGVSVLVSGYSILRDLTTGQDLFSVNAPSAAIALEPHRYERYLLARSAWVRPGDVPPPIGPTASARFTGAEFRVPEPASLALLALGLAGVLAARRKSTEA